MSLKSWLDEILRHSDPEITITLIGNKSMRQEEAKGSKKKEGGREED